MSSVARGRSAIASSTACLVTASSRLWSPESSWSTQALNTDFGLLAVVEPVACAVTMAESLVRIGLRHSKAGKFARPPRPLGEYGT